MNGYSCSRNITGAGKIFHTRLVTKNHTYSYNDTFDMAPYHDVYRVNEVMETTTKMKSISSFRGSIVFFRAYRVDHDHPDTVSKNR